MSILRRMFGAARLDSATYEEVEHDSGAMVQALAVVIVVSILSGLGEYLGPDNEATLLDVTLLGILRGLLFWAIWAFFIYIIGGKLLGTIDTDADWGQVARGTAFAQSPGVLNIFAFLSGVGGLIVLVVFLWQFVAVIVSVRQTLDYGSTARALFITLIAVVPSAIIWAILYGAIAGGLDSFI